MKFERISPRDELKPFVECYWTVENQDPVPIEQKIIPDGFPEMIFHYGDPYLIKLNGPWEIQSPNLLGGQITNHFFLKSTGIAIVLGIKFKPAALAQLFDISMHELTNKVIALHDIHSLEVKALESSLNEYDNHPQRISAIENFLMNKIHVAGHDTRVNKAIDKIFESNGMITVARLCQFGGTSERQLERLFKKFIGLSPKFYARVIQFSYIFQVIQGQKEMNGSELGIASGYYDQSHFIKNFKAFTGEDPSRYFFDQPSLANFFMNKK